MREKEIQPLQQVGNVQSGAKTTVPVRFLFLFFTGTEYRFFVGKQFPHPQRRRVCLIRKFISIQIQKGEVPIVKKTVFKKFNFQNLFFINV